MDKFNINNQDNRDNLEQNKSVFEDTMKNTPMPFDSPQENQYSYQTSKEESPQENQYSYQTSKEESPRENQYSYQTSKEESPQDKQYSYQISKQENPLIMDAEPEIVGQVENECTQRDVGQTVFERAVEQTASQKIIDEDACSEYHMKGQDVIDNTVNINSSVPQRNDTWNTWTNQSQPQYRSSSSQAYQGYSSNSNSSSNQNSTSNSTQNANPYQYPYQYYSNPQPVKSTNSNPNTIPKQKKKKQNKKIGIGSFVASILAVAVLTSSVTAVITTNSNRNYVDQQLSSSNAINMTTDGSGSTVINVTGESLYGNVETVAQVASPSVVGIRVTSTTTNSFFGTYDSSNEGSGVVYTSDGYIITNYHVISAAVEQTTSSQSQYGNFGGYGNFFGGQQQQQQQRNTAKVEVFLNNDNQSGFEAQIVGYDSSMDLAVLKIDQTGLTPIAIGDSDNLTVGEAVIAIGNPGGLEFMGSISVGIISGLNRNISTETGIETNLIQTDAAINPGNSGGALVDKEGKLIGINNSKMAGENFEGMGFAIPSNTVVEVTDRLIKNENEPVPYIGIYENTYYTADMLSQWGYPTGVVVADVSAGSPAQEAGIQKNDIITSINGVDIKSMQELENEKNKYTPGDEVTLSVFRNGQSYDVPLTLGQSN